MELLPKVGNTIYSNISEGFHDLPKVISIKRTGPGPADFQAQSLTIDVRGIPLAINDHVPFPPSSSIRPMGAISQKIGVLLTDSAEHWYPHQQSWSTTSINKPTLKMQCLSVSSIRRFLRKAPVPSSIKAWHNHPQTPNPRR